MAKKTDRIVATAKILFANPIAATLCCSHNTNSEIQSVYCHHTSDKTDLSLDR